MRGFDRLSLVDYLCLQSLLFSFFPITLAYYLIFWGGAGSR